MDLRLARNLETKPFNSRLRRFHPHFWTVDYNAEMAATLLPINDNSFKLSAQWRTNSDFVGVKWQSRDNYSHEYLRYATDNDYSRTVLAFRHNPAEPSKFTVTLATPTKSYTHRLAPYGLDAETDRYVCLDTRYSTGRTYPRSVIEDPSNWTDIPAGVVPFAERTDYIFILDFDDMRTLFDFDGFAIDPQYVEQISFDVVEWNHGLGREANVLHVGPLEGEPGRMYARIANAIPGAKLTKGDTLQFIYRTQDGRSWQDQIVVDTYEGFGTGELVVYYDGTPHGEFLEGDVLIARYLNTTSPALMFNTEKYFCDINVTGNRQEVVRKYYPQPEHDLMMTSGFDDNYPVTAERSVKMVHDLGYRGWWTQYIGMSHYFNALTGWYDKETGEYITMDRSLTLDVAFAGDGFTAGFFVIGDEPDRGVERFQSHAAEILEVEPHQFRVHDGATGSTATERQAAIDTADAELDPATESGLWWWDLENDVPGPALEECFQATAGKYPSIIIWSSGAQDANAIEFPGDRTPAPTVDRHIQALDKIFSAMREHWADDRPGAGPTSSNEMFFVIQEIPWTWTTESVNRASGTPVYMQAHGSSASVTVDDETGEVVEPPPPPADGSEPPADDGVHPVEGYDISLTWLSYRADPDPAGYVVEIMDPATGGALRSISVAGGAAPGGRMRCEYPMKENYTDFGFSPTYLSWRVVPSSTPHGRTASNYVDIEGGEQRPFDPGSLPTGGRADLPEPTAYQQVMDLRQAQRDFAAAQGDTAIDGASTAQFRFSDYESSPDYLMFSLPTFKMVAEDTAQRLYDYWGGEFPLSSGLEANNPDRYELYGELYPRVTEEPVNPPTIQYFQHFFAELQKYGYRYIHSVAYEILNFFMPEDWKQRNYEGYPALSGWSPPSCFIRPTSQEALDYISFAQRHVLRQAAAAGLNFRFQIGEPWWWDGSYTNGAPCIYDPITREMYTAETGNPVPTPWIENITSSLAGEQIPIENAGSTSSHGSAPETDDSGSALPDDQRAYLEWLRDKLGASTSYIRDQVREEFPDTLATLLFFTPQVLSLVSEITQIMNFPEDDWLYPEYDFVQIEDYDWVIDGRLDLVPQTFDAAVERLKYPREVVHYFAGFILSAQDYHIWPWIETAINLAKENNMAHVYIWSYTQAIRDSILYGDLPEDSNTLPILRLPPNWAQAYNINREYRTEILESRRGAEQRRSLRQTARKTLEFNAVLAGADMRRFNSIMAGWQNRTFLMPELTRSVALSVDFEAGGTVLELDEKPAWLALGATILLHAGDAYAAFVVRIIDGTVITLVEPDANGYTWPAGTTVYPALFGRVDPAVSTRRVTNRVTNAQIRYIVHPGSEPVPSELPEPAQTHEGVEVLLTRPNWLRPVNVSQEFPVEEVDFGFGTVETFRPVGYSSRTWRAGFLGVDRSAVVRVNDFFDRCQGRRVPFYMPTWEDDLIVIRSESSGTGLMLEGTEIADWMADDTVYRNVALQLVDGAIETHRVVSVERSGDDKTWMMLGSAVSEDSLDRLYVACWLPLWRLASDTLSISWLTDRVAEYELSLQTLEDN